MKWISVVLSFLILQGCEFPADPNHTLLNIQKNHILLVGSCANHENTVNPLEAKMLEEMAQHLNANVEMSVDTQENLYRKLENFQLHIVFCSIQDDSPWGAKVAFSNPYAKYVHANKPIAFVLGLPPGENAWLKYVNDFIFSKNQKR